MDWGMHLYYMLNQAYTRRTTHLLFRLYYQKAYNLLILSLILYVFSPTSGNWFLNWTLAQIDKN